MFFHEKVVNGLFHASETPAKAVQGAKSCITSSESEKINSSQYRVSLTPGLGFQELAPLLYRLIFTLELYCSEVSFSPFACSFLCVLLGVPPAEGVSTPHPRPRPGFHCTPSLEHPDGRSVELERESFCSRGRIQTEPRHLHGEAPYAQACGFLFVLGGGSWNQRWGGRAVCREGGGLGGACRVLRLGRKPGAGAPAPTRLSLSLLPPSFLQPSGEVTPCPRDIDLQTPKLWLLHPVTLSCLSRRCVWGLTEPSPRASCFHFLLWTCSAYRPEPALSFSLFDTAMLT